MNENNFGFLGKVLGNAAAIHAFLAVVLVILGLLLALITPVGVSKWYHVFFKLMMFMLFVMSFVFSAVSLIKGALILLDRDTVNGKILTVASLIVACLIILSIVFSIYSNPYIIDIFGLTKRTPMQSPNIFQQW
jgi:hypothetical protein